MPTLIDELQEIQKAYKDAKTESNRNDRDMLKIYFFDRYVARLLEVCGFFLETVDAFKKALYGKDWDS